MTIANEIYNTRNLRRSEIQTDEYNLGDMIDDYSGPLN